MSADYDRIQDVNGTTPFEEGVAFKELSSTQADITSVATGTYTSFTLTSWGIANVSKTGVSKFGIAEGHDINNDANTCTPDCTSTVGWYTSDTTGNSSDPKLIATTSVANVAPAEPTNLFAESSTNPINIDYSTPRTLGHL